MTALVIDASVAVKWFLGEDRWQEANALRERDDDLIAPTNLPFEVFHALWAASRTGRFRPKDVLSAAAIVHQPFARIVPVEELFEAAAQLAHSFSHPIYDCVYLALGKRESAPIITADERMFATARRARIKARLL